MKEKAMIPKEFIIHYLGAMTNYWISIHDCELQIDEKINYHEFEGDFDFADSLSEKTILGCALCYLLKNPNIDIGEFNASQTSWSEESLRNFTYQLIHLFFPNPSHDWTIFSNKLILNDTPLEDWRTNIKPGILQMLKEQGIEP